jgi:hypothetical protein
MRFIKNKWAAPGVHKGQVRVGQACAAEARGGLLLKVDDRIRLYGRNKVWLF